ncbi:beta 1,6 glucan synthase, partial [Rhodoplanes serenus]
IPAVRDIRGYGMMAGVEAWPEDGKPGVRGNRLQKELFWKGLHVKFTGDTAIVAPALIAEKSHVDEIVDILRQTLSVL